MSDREETYIYESPDCGNTIYRRAIGNDPGQRQLNSMSESKRRWDEKKKRETLWHEINEAAGSDHVLRDMLDKIIVYHQLKSQP